MYTDILIICDARAGVPASLPAVVKLVGTTGHMTVSQLVVEEIEPAATMAAATPVAVAPAIPRDEDRIKELRSEATEQRNVIKKIADEAKVTVDWHQEEGVINSLAASLEALARLHDLSVLGGARSEDDSEWAIFLERIVRESGRPCLVVPHGYECEKFAERIQINWDGSRSAARAVMTHFRC